MGKIVIILIVLLIFLSYTFLYWKLTKSGVKKEYGLKMWKNWTVRLYYWQAAVFYSIGFTTITFYILKWTNVLSF